MLDGLDDIDWKKWQAENVPIWIRQLASPDEEIRSKASAELHGQIICTDGSLDGIDTRRLKQVLRTDIHVLITPFLVELLTVETVQDKYSILSMLQYMAEYVKFLATGHPLSSRAAAIRDAVWAHHDVYMMCLSLEDVDFRYYVIGLLTEFSEHINDVLPGLQAFIQAPLNSDWKANVLWLVYDCLLCDSEFDTKVRSEFCDYLEQLLKTDPIHEVRITATVTIAKILGKATPQEAIAYLVETMINPVEQSTPFRGVLALLIPVQARTITRLGVEKGVPTAIKVMDQTQSVENCFYAFVAALFLTFYSEPIPHDYGILTSWRGDKIVHYTVTIPDGFEYAPLNYNTLNASQEAVIEAAIRHDCIWAVESNVFDFFGIPGQREALKRLLA